MKITIKDIAEKAGVSKTAVSFAFNSPEKISTETCQRIIKIANKLGYMPNPVARTLAMRHTATIGFLVPQSIEEVFQNPYVSEVMRGIGSVCHAEQFSLAVLSPVTGFLSESIKNALVDGIITLGIGTDTEFHTLIKQRGLPYVTIDAPHSTAYANVGIDDTKATEEIGSYLFDQGHRHIAICSLKKVSHDLTHKDISVTVSARFKGLQNVLKKNKIKVALEDFFDIYEMETSLVESYRLAKHILAQENRPTAVICFADVQAHGFYQAAEELGLRIPQDISIAGFDDIPFSQLLHPQLTTIHQPGYEKGYKAAQLLLDSLAGQSVSSVILPHELKIRGSVTKIIPLNANML